MIRVSVEGESGGKEEGNGSSDCSSFSKTPFHQRPTTPAASIKIATTITNICHLRDKIAKQAHKHSKDEYKKCFVNLQTIWSFSNVLRSLTPFGPPWCCSTLQSPLIPMNCPYSMTSPIPTKHSIPTNHSFPTNHPITHVFLVNALLIHQAVRYSSPRQGQCLH